MASMATGTLAWPVTMTQRTSASIFFNSSFQYDRRLQDLQTLLSESSLGFETAGVAADSVARLLNILGSSNVPITVGAGTQVVGAPTLTFSYQGLGTSRAVFAQIVNNSTGQVLGNLVTPLPVTLDGQQRTLSMDLSDIVYTYGGDTTPGSLTLQITSSATAYENLTSFGLMTISDVSVTLPNRSA